MNEKDFESVAFFRRFLCIDTTSARGATGPYKEAVDSLIARARAVGLDEITIIEEVILIGKPILIVSLRGSDEKAPSLLLNSHYDVVPVEASRWDFPAFEAQEIDGVIYGRGAQDMKSVCVQYIEALCRLKERIAKGDLPPLKRSVHASFVPDEETGSMDGAGLFVKRPEFKALNVGVSLDEGLANPENKFTVFYGQRALVWLKITATGPVGHGSRFIPRTAIEKLSDALGKIYSFRMEQQKLLHPSDACDHGCEHAMAKKLGDVVTVNVTGIKGFVPGPEFSDGFAVNCIPPEAVAVMDIRVPPSMPLEKMEAIVKDWTKEEGLSFSYYIQAKQHSVSSIRDDDFWWARFKQSFQRLNIEIEPEIFPAATDSFFFRNLGIPCFGFSPMRNTRILLHDHNECLGVKEFLEGIRIYEDLIADLANA